jgi:hypothetical protein
LQNGSDGELTATGYQFNRGLNEWHVELVERGGGCGIGIVDQEGNSFELGCNGDFLRDQQWQPQKNKKSKSFATGDKITIQLDFAKVRVCQHASVRQSAHTSFSERTQIL